MPAYQTDATKIAKVEYLSTGTANVAFADLPAPGQSLLLTGLTHAAATSLANLMAIKATLGTTLVKISFEGSPASITPPDTWYTSKLQRSLTIEA